MQNSTHPFLVVLLAALLTGLVTGCMRPNDEAVAPPAGEQAPPAAQPEKTTPADVIAAPPLSCYNPKLARPDMMCTQQYDPVCGCNNVTYPNGCHARNAGVLKTTPGKCGEPLPDA